jgi:protein SCO1/2
LIFVMAAARPASHTAAHHPSWGKIMGFARTAAIGLALATLLWAPPAPAQEGAITGRFLLTDMKGQTVTDENYAGKIRVMVFGYTFCPDICPTTLSTLSVALDQLGAADRAKITSLFVSIDPERDTPDHLLAYLSGFPDIVGLTGTPAQVAAAARNFKVRYERHDDTDGDPTAYTIDHSAGFYIMDRVGNLVARMPHASKPDRLAERIRSILHPKKADEN